MIAPGATLWFMPKGGAASGYTPGDVRILMVSIGEFNRMEAALREPPPALPPPPPQIDDRIFTDPGYTLDAVEMANRFMRACEDAARNGGPPPRFTAAEKQQIAEGLCRLALHGRQFVVSFDMPFTVRPLPKPIHEAGGPELLGALLEGIARLDRDHAADLLAALAARLRGG